MSGAAPPSSKRDMNRTGERDVKGDMRRRGDTHHRTTCCSHHDWCTWGHRATGTQVMAVGVITDRYHVLGSRLPQECVAEIFAVLKPGSNLQGLFQLTGHVLPARCGRCTANCAPPRWPAMTPALRLMRPRGPRSDRRPCVALLCLDEAVLLGQSLGGADCRGIESSHRSACFLDWSTAAPPWRLTG